jgi:NSS family neurotransmitter:Na+ symporter
MQRENFGNRFGVLVAMAGSAIGLGNLWRFPYMVGEYGGAAFIFVYIICFFLLCLPILIAEVTVGRRSQTNAFRAFHRLAPGSRWNLVGILMVATPIIVVSYYSVIGGWSIEYFIKACSLDFSAGADIETGFGDMFNGFITSVWSPVIYHTVYLLVTAAVVAVGVKSGIERFGKIMMPLLFVIMIVIAVRSATLPGAGSGLEWLFKPDFSKIDASVCAAALGQGFFSLSVGFGIMLTYGSYISKKENIGISSFYTAVSDLVFALIASCAIMPAVFVFGLDPREGPGLVFETLPFIFSNMPLGGVISILFFLALIVAALTSSISLFEVGVAYLMEERRMSRKKSSVIIFAITWLLGILCSLSFGPLSGLKLFGNTLFNFFDKFSANYLMPFGALLIVLFVGWRMKKDDVRDEFTNGGTLHGNSRIFGFAYFLIRYIAPLAIVVIFLSNLLW